MKRPAARRLPPFSFCLLPFAFFLLISAFCLPPAAAEDNGCPPEDRRQNTGDAKPASDVPAWPFFYYKHDPVTGHTETDVLWPVYVRHKTPDYTVNQILSVWQDYPAKYPNQFYFLWPLSGIRTGNGYDTWLFPVVWCKDDSFVLFPVVWYYDTDQFWLFPLVRYWETSPGRGNEREHSLNIALLQHNFWSPYERQHALWPLFWYDTETRSDRSSRHFGILPLVWTAGNRHQYKGGSGDSSAGGVLLLNWWNRRHSNYTGSDGSTTTTRSASDMLFPLFHRSDCASDTTSPKGDSNSRERSLWLMPYWQSHDSYHNDNPGRYGHRDTTESRHVLFPLWWDCRSRQDAASEASRTLFPLWWDWSGKNNEGTESGHLIFPLWWSSAKRDKAGDVAESAKFLVPLGAHFYKKGEYDTRNLLGPVFIRTRNEKAKCVRYDAFFPLLSMTRGETRSGGHLFPLAGWENERGKHENFWYLFPLGWRTESQEDAISRRADRDARFWALHEMEGKPFVKDTDSYSGPNSSIAFYPLFWATRQADKQGGALLPLWWRDTWRYGRSISTETWLPFVLGNYDTAEYDNRRTYRRLDLLLSILAWGRGDDYSLARVFPVFSYEKCWGRRELWSLLPPFDYESWRDCEKPDAYRSSELSVPFSWLPLFRTESRRSGADSASSGSWFFPFYCRSKEKSPARDVSRLSILWPLWNAEWENGETRIHGLGGLTNFYEKDANGFVEQRILYRLFTRHTRSWFSEHELMPFYAQQSREAGDAYWKVLGGLVGHESRGGRAYFRFLWIPIPAGRASMPDPAALAGRRLEHAGLALNYLHHNRADRAAIEFALAGDARANDREFQLAAAEAYLAADPGAVSEELDRASLPSSLEKLGCSENGDFAKVRKSLRTLAIRHFEAAIRLGADKPDTLIRIARACLDMYDPRAALARLDEADRLRPKFSTGMERLDVASRQWEYEYDRPAVREARIKRTQAVLAELQARYPDSPTVVMRGIAQEDMFRSHSYMSKTDAFSAETAGRLALYERAAAMTVGKEEDAWLHADPCNFRGNPVAKGAGDALAILNRQVDLLLDDKKTEAAEALFPRIRKLLPASCEACANPAGARPDHVYDSAVNGAMNNLYRLHLTMKNAPLGYITAAKEWAATLCPHQQKAVKQALESIRFEQQYLKQWQITLLPPPGSKPGTPAVKTVAYAGKFFDRYVDLDAVLGRPDHCTAAAECVIISPDERQAVLHLGFDHKLTAELNGAVVFGPKSRKIAVRDEFAFMITLHKGENRLKLTVSDDTLAYGFFARLSGTDGNFMEDVTVKP